VLEATPGGQRKVDSNPPLMSLVTTHREESFSGINVTPLTDVMLVLLITFLLSASSFESSTLSVPLPQVQDTADIETQAFILSVGMDGRVDWPDLSLQELDRKTAFQTLRTTQSQDILALAVHRDCQYGDLFPLVQAASESGWNQIILLTESTE
jgi:biopolymer transport protein TolR